MFTYDDEDDLEDGTGLVSPPVGVAQERADQREDVDRPRPLAHAVSSVGIVLPEHPRQEKYEVHPHPEERQGCQSLVHCFTNPFHRERQLRGQKKVRIIE